MTKCCRDVNYINYIIALWQKECKDSFFKNNAKHMSLSDWSLWYSNSVLSAMNLNQVEHINVCMCMHVHTLTLKFHLNTFLICFCSFASVSLFILSWHGTLYAAGPFKVHVSRSRCQFNGIFNACCATSTSRFPERGFGQRVQADIWRIDE